MGDCFHFDGKAIRQILVHIYYKQQSDVVSMQCCQTQGSQEDLREYCNSTS